RPADGHAGALRGRADDEPGRGLGRVQPGRDHLLGADGDRVGARQRAHRPGELDRLRRRGERGRSSRLRDARRHARARRPRRHDRGDGAVRRPRIRLAKPGLDGHDRGLKVVAMALRDAGAEVIYLGLRVPVADIAAAAAAEDAAVIGISVLSGAHLPIARQLLAAMRAAGGEAPLAAGGTVPPRDADALRRLGVAAVFAAGTPLPGVVEGVLGLASPEVAARGRPGPSPAPPSPPTRGSPSRPPYPGRAGPAAPG